MASEDFLIRLSVVFKKFGLITNEFLSVICQFLNVCIINLSLEFYISHFGNKTINGFCNKKTAPKNLAFKNRLAMLVTSALKSIKQENVTPEQIAHIEQLLKKKIKTPFWQTWLLCLYGLEKS